MAKKVASTPKTMFTVLDTNYPKIIMSPRAAEKPKEKKEKKEKKPKAVRATKAKKAKSDDAPKKVAKKRPAKKTVKK